MEKMLKVMTFNLRVNTPHDGKNAFPYRTERIRKVILHEDPDVIGFQEITAEMKAEIRRLLPEYTVVGCGRGVAFDGESVAIATKNDRIDLLALEQFWLSPTPTVPGSRYTEDQSSCPRMALSALLVVNGSKQPIRFCNTHLDHEGKQARYQGMMQIAQHLSSHPEPFILTGDMNAYPESPEVRLVTKVLGCRGAHDCTENIGGTFHGYGRIENPRQIDYIFSTLPCESAKIAAEPDDTAFYSDHAALVAELML